MRQVGGAAPVIVYTHARSRKPSNPMTDTLATLQGRIAWARDHVLRMTAEELVAALGQLPDPWRVEVETYTVSRYERGRRTVPLDYLTALSELSGVSLDWLVKGRGPVGTALDAISRVRHALDAIEAQYLEEPLSPPTSSFERLDDDG